MHKYRYGYNNDLFQGFLVLKVIDKNLKILVTFNDLDLGSIGSSLILNKKGRGTTMEVTFEFDAKAAVGSSGSFCGFSSDEVIVHF